MVENACSKTVWAQRGMHHQCCRRGVINEEGKWWCWQHAPSTVAAQHEEWNRKYKARRARDELHWKAEEAKDKLPEVVKRFLDEGQQPELRRLIRKLLEIIDAEKS